MTDDTPVPFQPQPFPTFADQPPTPEAPVTAQDSPKRKSRRARRGSGEPTKRTAAAPTRPSPAERPRRKYTRRAPTPVTQTGGAVARNLPVAAIPIQVLSQLRALSEAEYLQVLALVKLGRASCEKIFAATNAVLPK